MFSTHGIGPLQGCYCNRSRVGKPRANSAWKPEPSLNDATDNYPTYQISHNSPETTSTGDKYNGDIRYTSVKV